MYYPEETRWVMTQKLRGVFRTNETSEQVAHQVELSQKSAQPVKIATDTGTSFVATFVKEQNQVAVGTTESGESIAIFLGERARRSVLHGTIVIESP